MANWFLSKRKWYFNFKRIVFPTNDAGTSGYQFDWGGMYGSPHIDPYLTSWTTWQLQVYHKPKHNKCDCRTSSNNSWGNLYNLGVGKDFLTEHKNHKLEKE